MPMHSGQKAVLMLRPWLGTAVSGDAYAHFDALPMCKGPGPSYGRYGDYRILHSGDDGRHVLHLDNFRFQCQIDNRHAESYAGSWGYRPDWREVFTSANLHRYGPSLRAIESGLDKFRREDGSADTVGRLIVRLARILKLDGIAAIETSSNGSFQDGMEISWSVCPSEYGRGIALINDLEAGLHRDCARRVARVA